MVLYQSDYRSKARRDKSREAISLAMDSRWEEAAEVNRSILELFPDDVEAFNRLGKALLELGQYAQAQAAFARTLELSPSNAIAKKNLARLVLLDEEGQRVNTERKLTPQHFLVESGKTGTTVLEQPAPEAVLAKMAPGDPVSLEITGNTLVVHSSASEYLGQVQLRLAFRLIRLIKGGNRYEAAITSIGDNAIAIIIREVYQSPDQRGITSFPTQGVQDYQSYLETTSVQYSFPEGEEEDQEAWAPVNQDWDEGGEDAQLNVVRRVVSPENNLQEEAEDG